MIAARNGRRDRMLTTGNWTTAVERCAVTCILFAVFTSPAWAQQQPGESPSELAPKQEEKNESEKSESENGEGKATPAHQALDNPGGDDGRVRALTFDDIALDMEEGDEYSSDLLTEEVKSFRGKRISLRGYILPTNEQSGITSFVFVRDNEECCFGPGAAIYDCVLVKLKKDHSVEYTVRPVTVEGEFIVKEYRIGNRLMAIYRMKNCVVSQ